MSKVAGEKPISASVSSNNVRSTGSYSMTITSPVLGISSAQFILTSDSLSRLPKGSRSSVSAFLAKVCRKRDRAALNSFDPRRRNESLATGSFWPFSAGRERQKTTQSSRSASAARWTSVYGLPGSSTGRPMQRNAYRKVRKAARSSLANNSGCSQAAKWPPLSTSLK